ncbi:MAG: UDP-3-O-(3-hydroxymyristoyl)glucosamine N-acyltransferase [Bdellovibrionia bacterium]
MGFSTKDVIHCTGGRLSNLNDFESHSRDWEKIIVDRPASLGTSRPSELAFFFSRAFEHELGSANPGILITGDDFIAPLEGAGLPLWKTAAVIACRDPYLALAQLSELFAESLSTVAHAPLLNRESVQPSVIHPTASIAPSVELGSGVKIGPYCIIEDHVKVGDGVTLYPGCYVGPRCVIGDATVLFPRVTLYEGTLLGDRVRIHAGSVVGSDGFGYAPKLVDGQVRGHQKIYHLGRVVIENDVEIGANSCVDRGTFGETRIGKHSKLDNLVHIGHNSRLDEGAVICGGTCLAGNASVGKYAYVGGLTGIGNHVHVGDRAKVGALTMVTKDVVPGGTVVGNPQRDSKEHFRAHALLSKLLAERRSK